MCASKVPGQRRTQRVLAAILASLIGASQNASAQIPNPAALQEFEPLRFLPTEQRAEAEVRPGGAFFRIEGLPAETRQQLRRSAVAKWRSGHRSGLRHAIVEIVRSENAWCADSPSVGTIFIPDVSLDQVLAVSSGLRPSSGVLRAAGLEIGVAACAAATSSESICASSRRTSSPWFSTLSTTSATPASKPAAPIAALTAHESRSWSMPERPNERALPPGKGITACYGASIPSALRRAAAECIRSAITQTLYA